MDEGLAVMLRSLAERVDAELAGIEMRRNLYHRGHANRRRPDGSSPPTYEEYTATVYGTILEDVARINDRYPGTVIHDRKKDSWAGLCNLRRTLFEMLDYDALWPFPPADVPPGAVAMFETNLTPPTWSNTNQRLAAPPSAFFADEQAMRKTPLTPAEMEAAIARGESVLMPDGRIVTRSDDLRDGAGNDRPRPRDLVTIYSGRDVDEINLAECHDFWTLPKPVTPADLVLDDPESCRLGDGFQFGDRQKRPIEYRVLIRVAGRYFLVGTIPIDPIRDDERPRISIHSEVSKRVAQRLRRRKHVVKGSLPDDIRDAPRPRKGREKAGRKRK